MITFLLALTMLWVGYFVYGKVVEKIFGVDKSKETPAYTLKDGVDYVPMSWWRTFLIQFLNIAGLGPIFGAIAGAMWGPVAFLWIVFGSIFAGAVHDFLSGMMSLRMNGLSLPELTGKYLGKGVMQGMRFFTVALMIVVGAVFISGPAAILNGLTQGYPIAIGSIEINLDVSFWAIVVFVYYVLATMLPIDQIIGKIYPVFGIALLFMAVGIIGAIFYEGYEIPELWGHVANLHHSPDKFPVFPMMFITIACGAISGFHATQSPLMARCLKNEKEGRKVFYGAMVAEGTVALIWAAASMAFFGGVRELNDTMISLNGNAAKVVNDMSFELLGGVGAVLAILGVVAAPITSGDTAFRSARLIIADAFKFNQRTLINRLIITLPLFVAGFILTQINFDIIWRYMAWSNQTLATLTLWTITVFLVKAKKAWIISMIPAVFMTLVVTTYIFIAPEGLQWKFQWGLLAGSAISFAILALFVLFLKNQKHDNK